MESRTPWSWDGVGGSATWWSAIQNTEAGQNLGLSAVESRTRQDSRDCMEFKMPGTLGRGIWNPGQGGGRAEARMLGRKI